VSPGSRPGNPAGPARVAASSSSPAPAILGYNDSDIDPRERHLLGLPSSHADGKHVAADPADAAAAAQAHAEPPPARS
jgi:hypothetical protein